jgi:hypothetical protein
MDLGMPTNGNAGLAIRQATQLQMKMQRTMQNVHYNRTAQCENCRNYDCPVAGIPDTQCRSKMEADSEWLGAM